ncbi:MAG: hypothetical protein JW726_16305 [Anaerolineales bacterium]|nr:hypothetical protein [Anaerolineales bacterium]
MTASAFIAMLYGVLLEVLWLWDQTHGGDFLTWPRPLLGDQPHAQLRKPQWLAVMLGGAAIVLIGILELLGVGSALVYIDSPVPFYLFTLIGLFVFGAGVIWDGLLPRVNEKIILGAQMTILLWLLTSDTQPNVWATTFVLIVPAGVMLYLVIRKEPLNPLVKAVMYLWYLFSLILMLYQAGFAEMTAQTSFTLPEAFIFGTLFIFFLLHALFTMRFFLIASSMILPRNRKYIQHLMPVLYSDEQVPFGRFVILLLIVLALIGLNAWLGLLDARILVSVSVMLGAQVLFRARKGD